MADLVVKGGTVVDGTGQPGRTADIAIEGGCVVEVGKVDPGTARVIDADGLVVTPGFVDLHTHFDGQATWDPVLAPSSLHGVTTIAMGNCGVGFAPARPDRHDWLIGLLEGVEDIPGTALAEGLTWGWESYPEYLDRLGEQPRTLDVGAHLPHAALRTYVMGDRGADHLENPTDDEIATMVRLTAEALEAGAIGFATSRTEAHRTRDGHTIGTLKAEEAELLAIAGALASTGRGVVQLISDCYQTPDDEFADSELQLIESIARTAGRPLSFTVQQQHQTPDRWRYLLERVAKLRAEGIEIKGQVAPRPIGVLEGLQATANPFLLCASFGEISTRPLAERVTLLRDPERKARILQEYDDLVGSLPDGLFRSVIGNVGGLFELTDPVDYQLDADRSIGAEAARRGVTAVDLAYDVMLQDEGRQLLYLPLFNYAHGDLEDVREMLTSSHTLFGLSDAGAHCGAICDASMTTSYLTVWARDRVGDAGLPIEHVVHQITQCTAEHVGWLDRGVLAPGYVADLNVIDLDGLGCRPPEIVHDLPAGGRRLMQRAQGYRWTVKSGVPTFVDGEHTGELPGVLLRGATAR